MFPEKCSSHSFILYLLTNIGILLYLYFIMVLRNCILSRLKIISKNFINIILEKWTLVFLIIVNVDDIVIFFIHIIQHTVLVMGKRILHFRSGNRWAWQNTLFLTKRVAWKWTICHLFRGNMNVHILNIKQHNNNLPIFFDIRRMIKYNVRYWNVSNH